MLRKIAPFLWLLLVLLLVDWQIWLLLNVVIGLHELGHLWMMRRCGVGVETYMLGMGPRLLSFRRRGTEYRLNCFPFVGGVMPKTERSEQEHQANLRLLETYSAPVEHELPGEQLAEQRKRCDQLRRKIALHPPGDCIEGKTPAQKFLMYSAGIGVNVIAMLVSVALLLAVYGERQMAENYTVQSLANSGTAAAVLEPGDEITGINGEPLLNWEQLQQKSRYHDALELIVIRGGREMQLTVEHRIFVIDGDSFDPAAAAHRADSWAESHERAAAVIGVKALRFKHDGVALTQLPQKTLQSTAVLLREMALRLPGVLWWDETIQNLPAPYGLSFSHNLSIEQSTSGQLENLLLFSIVIHGFLALFNLLPIAPLDGGRMLYAGLRYCGFKVDEKFESKITSYGFYLLLGHIAYVLFVVPWLFP